MADRLLAEQLFIQPALTDNGFQRPDRDVVAQIMNCDVSKSHFAVYHTAISAMAGSIMPMQLESPGKENIYDFISGAFQARQGVL